MDKFWETHNFLRSNQEEIKTLNRPIMNSEMESVNKQTNKQKTYQPKKAPDQMDSKILSDV